MSCTSIFRKRPLKYFPICLVSNVIGRLLWPTIDSPLGKLSYDAVK